MQLILNSIENNLIVKFIGELDHHTTEQAREKIDDWYINKHKKNIILNLTELKFMDSSGIGLIMGRYKICKENLGKLVIVNSNSQIDRILKMSGICKIITIYSTLELTLDNIKESDF